ncbi:DUF4097 family beta strand repeat-containing protein [Luteimonas aquatica]|uniref:DUF4097 family beta strand repeat-containing protein n=1 Tax=Luteimonas aquatica TaxID=450364 RepID=UPI001F5827E5|nr:DUF4097 family beta strand repeat-containing protein [Luteimonas aquatica]
MKPQLIASLLLAGLACPAFASTPIDETRPLDARGTVSIGNLKGRIEVRVWDKPQVHIGGQLGDGVERLAIEGDSRQLDIKVRYPRNGDNRSEPTTLVVQVPRLASLAVESVSSSVDVSGTAGAKLSIDNVSGEVTVSGAPGRADIQNVSGSVRAALNSPDVSAQSVSGDIALRGRLGGTVKGEVVSGDLSVDSRGQRLRNLSVSSISGDISIRADLAESGRINVESTSGDIDIAMPKSLSARVTGKSFSGDVSAPGARVNRARHGPGSDFDQRYGGGGGVVELQTFSGDASLTLY